jgi:hypothetical protein
VVDHARATCRSRRAGRRLYREEGLQVGRRSGRKRAVGCRAPITIPQGPNQRWSLDFASEALSDGRRFRILAIVDDFTRESLALIADTSLPGLRVVRELDFLIAVHGCPAMCVSRRRFSAEPVEFLGCAHPSTSAPVSADCYAITIDKPEKTPPNTKSIQRGRSLRFRCPGYAHLFTKSDTSSEQKHAHELWEILGALLSGDGKIYARNFDTMYKLIPGLLS